MVFTRAQVDAAKTALGLDHDLTHSISISPRAVYVQTVTLVDGYPVVDNGETRMDAVTHDIDEEVQA